MDTYQGLLGKCAACSGEWKLYTLEWPPKVVICPTCHDLMVLQRYEEDREAAVYVKAPYPQRDQND